MFLETMDDVSCLLAALSLERMHGQAPRVSRASPQRTCGGDWGDGPAILQRGMCYAKTFPVPTTLGGAAVKPILRMSKPEARRGTGAPLVAPDRG